MSTNEDGDRRLFGVPPSGGTNRLKKPFKCGMESAPVFAPVFTALRRDELLRRGKECGVRPNLISVIAKLRTPSHARGSPCGIRNAEWFTLDLTPALSSEERENHPPSL